MASERVSIHGDGTGRKSRTGENIRGKENQEEIRRQRHRGPRGIHDDSSLIRKWFVHQTNAVRPVRKKDDRKKSPGAAAGSGNK